MIEVSLSIGVELLPMLFTIFCPPIVTSVSIGSSVMRLIFKFFNVGIVFYFCFIGNDEAVSVKNYFI